MGDLGKLDGDDEWRGGSTGCGLVGKGQVFGVVRYDHPQEENGQAVEEENSVEGKLDGARDGLARVLGLSDGDTDELSTQIGKNRVDQRAPESVEFACIARGYIRLESTGIVVVLEASRWARSGSNGQQE